MSPKPQTTGGPSLRRSIAVICVVLVLVAAPGCSSLLDGGDDGGVPSGPALDTVPGDVDSILFVDVNGTLEDEQITTIANTVLGLDDAEPRTLNEAIARAEANTTLDVSDLRTVTAFGRTRALNATDGYGAAIVTAEWSLQTVVNEIENESDVTMESTQFAGRQFWQPTEQDTNASYLGRLGEHRFVIGTEEAVKDALRVASGNNDPVDGALRTAFEATHDEGYVRFATTVPQEDVDTGELPGNTQIFNDVTMVTGSMYVENQRLTVNATMTFGTESAADDAQSVIEGAIQIWRGGVVEDPHVETLIAEENLTVSQNGPDVTVSASNTGESISAAIHALYDSWFGVPLGTEQAVDPIPAGA